MTPIWIAWPTYRQYCHNRLKLLWLQIRCTDWPGPTVIAAWLVHILRLSSSHYLLPLHSSYFLSKFIKEIEIKYAKWHVNSNLPINIEKLVSSLLLFACSLAFCVQLFVIWKTALTAVKMLMHILCSI